MSKLIWAALGVVFAAFCIWLVVRLINRRERWAKRTMMWLAVALTLYFLSSGPAVWIFVHYLPKSVAPVLTEVYFPFGALAQLSPTFENFGIWYMHLWVSQDDQLKKWQEP